MQKTDGKLLEDLKILQAIVKFCFVLGQRNVSTLRPNFKIFVTKE